MGNPFKKITQTANETQKRWTDERKESKSGARTCEGCGAPRPKDTNLTTCDYCGFKFMTIDTEIKTDT